MENRKKIGLDIDEVICDFIGGFCEVYSIDRSTVQYWKDPRFSNKLSEVLEDKEFYLNLKPLVTSLDFEPVVYITSRNVPTEVTKQWLDKNGFPYAPVETVGAGQSKVDAAKKYDLDVFIDDSIKNFRELNNAGIFTKLMDAPHNQYLDVGHFRVKDLKNI